MLFSQFKWKLNFRQIFQYYNNSNDFSFCKIQKIKGLKSLTGTSPDVFHVKEHLFLLAKSIFKTLGYLNWIFWGRKIHAKVSWNLSSFDNGVPISKGHTNIKAINFRNSALLFLITFAITCALTHKLMFTRLFCLIVITFKETVKSLAVF